MRLGVNVDFGHKTPDEWIHIVRRLRVRTVVAPMQPGTDTETKKAYLRYMEQFDLTVGEVGVWNNVLSPDPHARKSAIDYAKDCLALADEIGAVCCVNTAGSHGIKGAAYHPDNYHADTYTQIVDTARDIIDAVKPKHTFYTIEPMPWMHPDSPDDYLALLRDIDRTHAAAHLDYTNMINSVSRYHNRTAFIKECFQKLGSQIKSIHAKDVHFGKGLPCCLNECIPGTGGVDFPLVLRLASRLHADIPMFVEHMQEERQYQAALQHLHQTAETEGVFV